jgi:periplasmic copper chaperone A
MKQECTMSNNLAALALVSGLLSLMALPAAARSYTLAALKIGHPWSRPTPPRAPTAAGYLSITNTGKAPDRLLSATSPDAATLEVHHMSTVGGVMRMRPIVGGLVVPPGDTVTLAPNSDHLMFIGPKRPFRIGDHIPATLTFEHAGSVKVEFYVEQPPAASSAMPGMAM